MGNQAKQSISEKKKGLFRLSSGVPGCCLGPPEKGNKGRKRLKKADFGWFPGREGRHLSDPNRCDFESQIASDFDAICCLISGKN